jgi:hypothetical protein
VVKLYGLIIIAVAIAFGCREIAILLVVILNDFGRRLFAAIPGRLVLFRLFAGSTHVREFLRYRLLTSISPPLAGILTARCAIFTAFFRGSV